jgi:hypothetical protein
VSRLIRVFGVVRVVRVALEFRVVRVALVALEFRVVRVALVALEFRVAWVVRRRGLSPGRAHPGIPPRLGLGHRLCLPALSG